MNAKPKVPRIFWFSTKGTGSNDAIRIDTLLSGFETRKEIPFSKDLKLAGLREFMKTIRAEKPVLGRHRHCWRTLVPIREVVLQGPICGE